MSEGDDAMMISREEREAELVGSQSQENENVENTHGSSRQCKIAGAVQRDGEIF